MRNKIITVILLGAAALIVALGVHQFEHKSISVISSTGRGEIDAPEVNDTKEALAHPLIPGGVSLKSLRRRILKDTRLAQFYKANGFDITCAFETSLANSEFASVTYRRGKDIVWTNKPLLLLKGENVIEDCHGNVIRSKCGNLILKLENADYFDIEDNIEADLIQPAPPVPILPETPLPIVPSFDMPPVRSQPPMYPVYPGFCCTTVPTGGVPPTKTPEASTGLYLLTGLAGLVLMAQSARYRL